MKKIKSQNGAISALVLATMLLFIVVLAGTYLISANVRKAQMKNQRNLKEIYQKDLSDLETAYTSLTSSGGGTEEGGDSIPIEEFECTGASQMYIIVADGIYQIECWGASSGNGTGRGSYTKGRISLERGDTLYIYVGQRGHNGIDDTTGGWNGGGQLTNPDSEGDAPPGRTGRCPLLRPCPPPLRW